MSVAAVPFEALPAAVQALGKRRLIRLSKEGKAPPFVRISAYSPPLWSAVAIANFVATKVAPLAPATNSPPANPSHVLIETFDGEPTP